MKTIALDIGDVWTGVAISDALSLFARPLQTVETAQLTTFLTALFKEERIDTAVVGHPKTMRGRQSEQTDKVEVAFHALKEQFSNLTWILWDERLSSKRAEQIQKEQRSQDKKQSHALAAAVILSTYLDYKSMQKQLE